MIVQTVREDCVLNVLNLLEAAKNGLERMEAELERCGGKSDYLEARIKHARAVIEKFEGK